MSSNLFKFGKLSINLVIDNVHFTSGLIHDKLYTTTMVTLARHDIKTNIRTYNTTLRVKSFVSRSTLFYHNFHSR